MKEWELNAKVREKLEQAVEAERLSRPRICMLIVKVETLKGSPQSFMMASSNYLLTLFQPET